MNIPEELARRESRLEAIAAAKAQIEQCAPDRFANEQKKYKEKLSARKTKGKETGKKPKGRPPTPPEPGPKSKDQVILTDIDSMLIVENHITQQSNDKLGVAPAMEEFCRLPDNLGTVDTLVADAGYFSGNNVKECETHDIVPYIAAERQPHNAPPRDRFIEPASLSPS